MAALRYGSHTITVLKCFEMSVQALFAQTVEEHKCTSLLQKCRHERK